MSDSLRVQVANSQSDLSCVEFHHILRESFLGLEDFVEFSSADEGHDEVETERALEQVVHAHEERVVAGEQDILLQLCVINLVEFQQDILSNTLNGVKLVVFIELCKVHFPKGSPSEDHH